MIKMNKKISIRFLVVVVLSSLFLLFTSNLYAKTNQQLSNEPFYISEQAFGVDKSMSTLFSHFDYGFQVENWQVKAADLHLELSTTTLAMKELSTLTIEVNGIPFYSENIAPTNGLKRQLVISVPPAYLKEGYNQLSIKGYLRTEALPCVDDVSPANWLNVFKDSFISLKYTPLSQVKTISDFYTNFGTYTAIDYDQSAIAFPKEASLGELSIVSKATAALSKQMSKDYYTLDFIPTSTLNELEDKQYILYISSYEHLPSVYRNLLSKQQQDTAKSNALLALLETEAGQNVLLLVGNNLTALEQGANVLAYPALATQLNYVERTLYEDEDFATLTPSSSDYFTLTEQGTTLEGSFRQSAEFYIDVPPNRALAEGSELYLEFRYSQNLNFSRSLVSAYINDIPIGSRRLFEEKADSDTLTLQIPKDIDISGGFNLKIAFDLEVEDLWCTLRLNEMPWAFIAPNSALKINSVDIPFKLFEYFPAPFIKDRTLNNLVMILPETPTSEDYQVLGSIMKTLGHYVSNNQGSVEVRSSNHLGDLTDKNIISIGTFKENSFTASLNEKLYFKFAKDGSYLLSNEKLRLDPNYASSLGTVQILTHTESDPWSTVLVVSGSSLKGMLTASSYLSYEEGLWKLSGDGYIARDEDLSTYAFKEDNAKTLSFSNQLSQQPELIGFIIFASMILVIIILAIILLFIKYRKENNNEH